MSSRLFIARIIPMLLLLLGVFGTAVADSGGGVAKKVKGTAFFSIIEISVLSGGSSNSAVICATGQQITIRPTLSDINSTSSVSYTILRGTDSPVSTTVSTFPYSLLYTVATVSITTGFTVIATDNSLSPTTLQRVFTLEPPPTLVVTPSATTICEGNPVEFSQSASAGLTLLGSAYVTGVTGTTSVTATPTASGPLTFNFTGIDSSTATGCAYTATASVTVVPTSATLTGGITAGRNVSLCSNQVLSFTASCPTNSTVLISQVVSTTVGPPGSTTNVAVDGAASTTTIAIYSPTSSTSNTQVFSVTAGSFTSTAAGSYVVSCSSAACDGVGSAKSYTLTVNPLPTNGPTVAVAYSTSATSLTSSSLSSLTITSTAASSGTAVTVCQNTPLSLSVLGCVASTTAGATNPITQVSGPVGSVGVGSSVTLAGGVVQDVYLISTANLSTTASGPYVYTIACLNSSGCSSTAIASLSVTVIPSPNLASITAVGGTPANLAVAGGGTGAVNICQSDSPLIVNSNCLVAASGTTSETVGGTSSSTIGTIAGTSTTALSATFVSFSINAATVGTFSFSFVCVNASGCQSPIPTVLTVTVNSTVVAPTFTGSTTACLNSGALSVSALCSTPSGASLVITGANGIASIADVNSTTATGARSYTLQCVTPTCVSSTTSLTVTVRDLPANAGLTPSVGSPITAGGAGTVAICQNSPLLVTVTGCPVSSTTSSITGTAGTSTNNFGVGNIASTSTTSGVNSFSVNTATVGTFSFTVNCANEFLCTSPQPTTITVTVNSSVAAPTLAGSLTACETPGGLLSYSATCSTSSSLVVLGTSGLTTLDALRSTSTAGVFSYTLSCVTPTCTSSTSVVSTTIVARPNLASITAVNGTPANVAVVGGGTGAVAICQGNSPLIVNSNCLVTPGGSLTSSGVVVSSSIGAGVSVGISTTATSATFVSFSISAATAGTFSYSFNCVNESGCQSLSPTILTVTVNSSVATPTFAGSTTACLNSGALSVSALCSTPSGASLVITGANGIASIADVNSTTATGARSYTLQCVTPTCVSSTTSLTVTVRDLPDNAGLTVNSGATTLATVTAAGSGTVAVCQNQSLTVVTSCVANADPISGSANAATGATAGSGSVVAIVNTTPGSTSITYATFIISTSSVNTTTFTFRCKNEFGCESPNATTLALVVSTSVASPTIANATSNTGCENSGTLGITAGCTTPTGVSLVVTDANGITTLADLRSTAKAPGTYTYTLKCVTQTCESSTTTVTTTITPRPNLASLTAVNTNGVTLGGTSGSVSICQGSSLTVLTDCFISSTATNANANTATGGVSGSATAGVIIVSNTASTYAQFVITTDVTGTSAFTFNCVNQFGCTSPTPTTLTITTSQSAAAPTGVNSQTVCQFDSLVVTPSCAVGTAIISGAQSGTTSLSIETGTSGLFNYSVLCRTAAGCTSTSVPFTVFVNGQPNNAGINLTSSAGASQSIGAGASGAITICEGTSLMGTVTGCLTTTGTIGGVSAPATGSGQISIGGSTPVSTTSSTNTFTISGSLAAGTYNYTLVCTSVAGSVTCTSPLRTSLVVTVNGAPVSPTAAYASTGSGVVNGSSTLTPASPSASLTVCLNTPVNLTVTGCNPNTPGSTNVTSSSTSGGAILTGSTTSLSSINNSFFTIPNGTAGVFNYSIVCTNAAGCASLTTLTLDVTVNSLPGNPVPTTTQGVLPNLVVCEGGSGSSLTIGSGCTPSSSVTAVFTIPSTLTSRATVVGNSLVISTSGLSGTAVTETISVICRTVSTSCVSATSSSVSLTINPAPAAPIGATIAAGTPPVAVFASALTICQGQPVSLTVNGCQMASGSGGATTIGGNGSGFIFAGTGFTFTPTGPTTSTALVTDGNLQQGTYTFNVKCQNATTLCESLTGTSFTLVVTGQPSAVVASGFAPTCSGGSPVTGTLGCSVGFLQAGIQLAGSTSFTVVTSPVTLPAVSGNYTVTAVCTTGGACLGTPLSFTVNNQLNTPAPSSIQTVLNAVCLGQSTTLTAGCSVSATFFFTDSGLQVIGTPIGNTALVVTPGQQGQFSYYAVCSGDPNFACVSSRSTNIILNVLPGVNSQPTISAQPNPSVAGSPVTLTGAGCVGTTIFYIQGTNTEVGRGTGALVSLIVNPQVTTIYDAVCTNGQCTSSRTTGLVVSVVPCNFVATVTPSSAVICATGGSVVLTASGGVSYVWNNGANTQQITVSAAGVYNVVITSAQGCTVLASATITTGTAPSPTITGNTTIFAGQSTTLTAGGGGLYAWSGPGLAPNAGGAAQVVSQAGVYMVTVTSPTGCTASANVTVTVSALPGAPTVTPTTAVAPSAPLQACVGQTIQLVASCPTGSMPRFKMGAITNDAATQNVTGNVAGLVTYQVVCVAGGQEGPATAASINFNTVPTVQILQTGVLCNNQPSSVTLSATGASSYTWSTGATTQSIVVNAGAVGLYSVNGMQGGCVGTATQMVIAVACTGTVTPFAISGATIDCVNGNVTIAATGGNGNQIQYSIGGVQYQPSNPVALNPDFQNNAANTFVQLFVRQVNSTSTGFDIAGPFQFNFRAICPVPTPPTPPAPVTTTCGSPANTIGQPLVVTGVTDINCLNGSFRVLTTGGNGSAIDFSVIVGLSNVDPNNCVRRVDNGQQLAAINNPNSSIGTFRIDVKQGTTMSAPFFFDFKGFCTGTPSTGQPSGTGGGTGGTPTTASPVATGCGSPANTVGQPLTITNVDQVNCVAGTFRILTTGGTGNTINYANIVGLSNTDPYNCTRTLDNPDLVRAVNNSGSTIAPFQLSVRNVDGGMSNTFSFNMKQVCTGTARVARTEGTGNLDITVLGNPTLGETVEVEVRGAEGQALQLRLVDGMGAAISEKSVEKAGAVERQTIGLGRSAGMYFLQVTTPDKTKTVKVVRQ